MFISAAWTAGDLGLVGIVTASGGALLTLMRFWYGTIKERIDELRDERDYWRRRADPHWQADGSPTEGE
jgi:hypothetical protein